MVQASVNGIKIASTDSPVLIEGNQYFPPTDVDTRYFKNSAKDTHTTCPWKQPSYDRQGEASYYDIHLDDGTILEDAAWYYPGPTKEKAKHFEGYVAFYKNKVDIA